MIRFFSERRTETSSTSTSTSTTTSNGPGTPPLRGNNSGRQLQHPPLSELADAMDELQATEDRFRPFRQQMYELLRNDPIFPNEQSRLDAQQLFNRSTEVMHLLSHVQHALSDAVVNMNQGAPRHIRASPLVIQSRSAFVPIGPTASNLANGRPTQSQEQQRQSRYLTTLNNEHAFSN